jgi:hypothetical protein
MDQITTPLPSHHRDDFPLLLYTHPFAFIYASFAYVLVLFSARISPFSLLSSFFFHIFPRVPLETKISLKQNDETKQRNRDLAFGNFGKIFRNEMARKIYMDMDL